MCHSARQTGLFVLVRDLRDMIPKFTDNIILAYIGIVSSKNVLTILIPLKLRGEKMVRSVCFDTSVNGNVRSLIDSLHYIVQVGIIINNNNLQFL